MPSLMLYVWLCMNLKTGGDKKNQIPDSEMAKAMALHNALVKVLLNEEGLIGKIF